MKELVTIKGREVFCSSQDVAEKFGIQHIRVLAIIKNLQEEYAEIKVCTSAPLNFQKTSRVYRGKEFSGYIMDRRSFSLLAMRFKGKLALEWQVKFNDAFYKMERDLLLEESNRQNVTWNKQREQGKLARKEETDTIKEFVDYATRQGSKNAQFYYKHVTVACYRCLQLIESNKPRLRDLLDVMELSQLMLAETVAERSLVKHMEEGEHYTEIFSLVKEDLERFAQGLMLPHKKNKEIK